MCFSNTLDDCVEVGVDQVHIHDSTAQMSTIQKKLTTVSTYYVIFHKLFTYPIIKKQNIKKYLR